MIVTEYGAFDLRGLSISERAVGIAHLAAPDVKEELLKKIYDSPAFHHSAAALSEATPEGFVPFASVG